MNDEFFNRNSLNEDEFNLCVDLYKNKMDEAGNVEDLTPVEKRLLAGIERHKKKIKSVPARPINRNYFSDWEHQYLTSISLLNMEYMSRLTENLRQTLINTYARNYVVPQYNKFVDEYIRDYSNDLLQCKLLSVFWRNISVDDSILDPYFQELQHIDDTIYDLFGGIFCSKKFLDFEDNFSSHPMSNIQPYRSFTNRLGGIDDDTPEHKFQMRKFMYEKDLSKFPNPLPIPSQIDILLGPIPTQESPPPQHEPPEIFVTLEYTPSPTVSTKSLDEEERTHDFDVQEVAETVLSSQNINKNIENVKTTTAKLWEMGKRTLDTYKQDRGPRPTPSSERLFKPKRKFTAKRIKN